MSLDNFSQSLANLVVQKGLDLVINLEIVLNRKRNIHRLVELLQTVLDTNDLINQIKSHILFEFSNNYPPSDLVHDLTTSLCLVCFQNRIFNQDLFRDKCSILKPFLNKNYELEVDCLKAIQRIDDELDETNSSFIRAVFDIFGDCCMVRDGAYSKWRTIGQPENKRSIERLTDFFSIECHNKRLQTRLLRENLTNLSEQTLSQLSENQPNTQSIITNQPSNNLSNPINIRTTSNQVEQNRFVQIFEKYESDEVKLLKKLKAQFNNKQTLNKNEICALIDALMMSCTDSNRQFKITSFNKRSLVLKHFINQNEAIEIETLKTIQAFLNQIDHKTPGFDQVIFLFLYENYVINEKALNAFTQPQPIRRQQQRSETISNQNQPANKNNQSLSLQINSIFARNNYTTSYVTNRLQNEFNQATKESQIFITELVLAFLKSCLYSNTEFHLYSFKNKCNLLKTFVRKNIHGESETLTCVVKFCRSIQSPIKESLLGVLFDILYMEKIIKQEAFLKWKTNASEHNKQLVKEFFHKLTELNSQQMSSTQNLLKNDKKSAASDVPEPVCSICIETISSLKKSKIGLMSTQCGHIMCKLCTENFFSKSQSSDCPICRKKLTKNLVHDLFI